MPAILHPLVDATTHVIQPKRICPETADLDGLFGGRFASAVLAIGHARLKLVAPPIFGLRSTAGGIFPFRLARQSICLARCACEPGSELPGFAPADVRDGRISL